MIRGREPFFNYTLVRCADPDREEHLNVGVVVVDRDTGETVSRFDTDLSRVRAAFPHLPISHLSGALREAGEAFSEMVREGGVERLQSAANRWDNLIRLSNLKVISATTPHEALDLVYRDSVGVPLGDRPDTQVKSGAGVSSYASKTVVNGWRDRLIKRGLKWDELLLDHQIDVPQEHGRAVPIQYPMVVNRTNLFDAIDVTASSHITSWERAMLASQKSEEVLRSGDYRVTITIRETDGENLMYDVKQFIEEEGSSNGQRPLVFTIRKVPDLDPIVRDMRDVGSGALFKG